MSDGTNGQSARDRPRRRLPLSPDPAERALQWWVIGFCSWLVLSAIVVLSWLSTLAEADLLPDALWPIRLALALVATALCGLLWHLVGRHRAAIARTTGLKGQYVLAGRVAAGLSAVGLLGLPRGDDRLPGVAAGPWWWGALAVAAAAAAASLRASTLTTLPPEQRTARIDYDSPEHWTPRGRFADRPGLHLASRLGLAVIGGLALAAVIVGVLLLGDRLS